MSKEIDKLPETEFYTAKPIEFNNVVDKKTQALKIIKEKRVDVGLFFLCENAEDYNFQVSLIDEDNENYKELTQEEFDLLKEVLLCE